MDNFHKFYQEFCYKQVENQQIDDSPTYCQTISLLFLVADQSGFTDEFLSN